MTDDDGYVAPEYVAHNHCHICQRDIQPGTEVWVTVSVVPRPLAGAVHAGCEPNMAEGRTESEGPYAPGGEHD